MHALKRLFRFVVSTPGVVPKLLQKSDSSVIFMLHRFPDPELGNQSAHNVDVIRSMLALLRRRRFELLPLSTLFERAQNGQRLNGAVAFTIDDGYMDHATVAAPLFAEFDCPVTTFLTTGFLDGKIWFWWDQIDYVFRTTERKKLTVALGEGPGAPALDLAWTTPQERDSAQGTFTVACKQLREDEKRAAIARLSVAAEVEIPIPAPVAYGPMSWSDARRCEDSGMTFGPHTVTHPILARASDEQSRFEIEESWRRLKSEVAQPAPVFCYPNGQDGDYSKRETDVIGECGLRGSVVGTGGYATGTDIRHAENRFRVRRFAMPENVADMIQYVTGLERVKERIRAARG